MGWWYECEGCGMTLDPGDRCDDCGGSAVRRERYARQTAAPSRVPPKIPATSRGKGVPMPEDMVRAMIEGLKANLKQAASCGNFEKYDEIKRTLQRYEAAS